MEQTGAGGLPPPPMPATPPPEGSTPWWKRRTVLVAAAVAAVLGVVGLLVGIAAYGASSSTRDDVDETTAQVAETEDRVADEETRRDSAQQRIDELAQATTDVADAAFAFEVSSALTVAAQNAQVEVSDEAVARINAGATQEGQDIIRDRGVAVADDYQAAVEAQLEALSDLQTAVNALGEVVDDG